MKTSINVPSFFCAALALMVIFCSTGLCTRDNNNLPDPGKRLPPTSDPPSSAPSSSAPPSRAPPAHYYNRYPTARPNISQLLDGTSAALYFMGQANTTQGLLLPMSQIAEDIYFRDALTSLLKLYQTRIVFDRTSVEAALIRELKIDLCRWVSKAMKPATNFTCTPSNIQELSQVLDLYQALRSVDTKVTAIATGHTISPNQLINNCAWVNSHVLHGCAQIPAPQSDNQQVIALERVYSCNRFSGNYSLCSNV